MLPIKSPAQARASAVLPFRRPEATAPASGTAKPIFSGSQDKAATVFTNASAFSSVLSQLNVYWRTSSNSRTHTNTPASVDSHKLCAAAPMRQRTAGFVHSPP